MDKSMMNVLLVEDNEGDAELIRIAFKKSGLNYALSIVHDGTDALDFLYKKGDFANTVTPDIVLIDLNMPRMGGKEFLEIVKNDESLSFIPVIVLTSSQNPLEILECYKRHANSYILKPSGLDCLIDLLKQLENYWIGQVQLLQRLAI